MMYFFNVSTTGTENGSEIRPTSKLHNSVCLKYLSGNKGTRHQQCYYAEYLLNSHHLAGLSLVRGP